MGNKMKPLTDKQKAYLTNLPAFEMHFPDYEVRRFGYQEPYFYIVPKDSENEFEDYIQESKSFQYINGYMYGAVQVVCGQLKKGESK